MLNPKVNYAKLIPVAPAETSRVPNTVYPTNNATISSTAPAQLDFNIPATAYLDPSASYLKFRCQVRSSALGKIGSSTNAFPVNFTGIACLDGGGLAAIESVWLYNSENMPLTYIQDFPAYALARLRERGLEYNEVARLMMGYSEVFDEESPSDMSNGINTYGQRIADKVARAYIQDETPSELPGALMYRYDSGATGNDIGSALPLAGTGQIVEYCIPAWLLSGLWDQANYIPLLYMGSKASALRLVIKFNTSARAIVATSVVYNPATGSVNHDSRLNDTTKFVSLTSPWFDVSNAEFVVEYVNIAAQTDATIRDAIYKAGGVRIQFPDYSTQLDTQMSTSANYSSYQTRTAVSLKSVILQFRKNVVPSYIYPNITGTSRFDVNSVQLKLGAIYWPTAPLEFPSSQFNGAAYAEFLKRSGSLRKKSGGGFAPRFHDAKNSFEMSFDFDEKDQSDSAELYTNPGLNGINLNNGANSIVALIRRGPANPTVALQLTFIFCTDNVLVVENNRANVLENRA